MLTRLKIKNFKQFTAADIELGNPVVFIGPNNSGKTTALQAIGLWDIGLRKWNDKRAGREAATQRPGVAINRKDLVAVPIPNANLLWTDLHVRDVQKQNGKSDTKNIRIEVTVEGVTGGAEWLCGLEFDYANEESLYCRPLRTGAGDQERLPVPAVASAMRVAFLPPMSGLADREFVKLPGEIGFLVGQGRTAEVLRNLCFMVRTFENEALAKWEKLAKTIFDLFGIQLDEPLYSEDRGEISMVYRTPSGTCLDISSAGRGVHQTILLLAYLATNPRSVLLLDEPDAHLEILRQRQIYRVLADAAAEQDSQIIIASHSEVVLNEAAERDVVVAFVGTPHRINDRGSHVLKSLKDIGFEDYYLAEQRGWVLYLEGSTDLSVLQSFAERLGHPAAKALSSPFVRYVENQPQKAREHFFGLSEAKKNLRGVLLSDRLDREPQDTPKLRELRWRKNEIENYLCQPATLREYARSLSEETAAGPLFEASTETKYEALMERCIQELVPPLALRDPRDRWWSTVKASEELLERTFELFFGYAGLPNLMKKANFHVLAKHVPVSEIDPEVGEKLDVIQQVSISA